MDFVTLQSRLLARVRAFVQNGELTERGLARMIGISQPHMHHILKGARGLSVETADRILARLRLSLFDLLEEDIFEFALPAALDMAARETELTKLLVSASVNTWEERPRTDEPAADLQDAL
jgi:transcriptional regulator with XRE-family HTH domain